MEKIVLTLDDVEETSTEVLVAFFNQNSKTKVEEFKDRPTAIKRVRNLIKRLADKPPVEERELTPEELEAKAAAIKAKRAEGTSRSWNDDTVRAKRTKRDGVLVDGVYYASVEKAYRALGLPLKNLIKHRAELKAAGYDFIDEEYGMTWQIAPFQPVEKKSKKKVKPETDEAAEAEQAEAA